MKTDYQPLSWQPVPGHEGYHEINLLGTIRSIDRKIPNKSGYMTCKKQYIQPRINNSGYLEVRLYKNGRRKCFQIHRILAFAFIPNPENKPEVNHINGIKTDNRLENLEWATRKENMAHAKRLGLLAQSKIRKVKDICTGKVYDSLKEAAEIYQLTYRTFKSYLNGSRKNPTCLRYLEQAA